MTCIFVKTGKHFYQGNRISDVLQYAKRNKYTLSLKNPSLEFLDFLFRVFKKKDNRIKIDELFSTPFFETQELTFITEVLDIDPETLFSF